MTPREVDGLEGPWSDSDPDTTEQTERGVGPGERVTEYPEVTEVTRVPDSVSPRSNRDTESG